MSGKMSITSGDKVFYYMTRDSLCFLAMSEARYPKRLAFLYLDEIGDLVLGQLVQEFGNQVRVVPWRRVLSVACHTIVCMNHCPISLTLCNHSHQ